MLRNGTGLGALLVCVALAATGCDNDSERTDGGVDGGMSRADGGPPDGGPLPDGGTDAGGMGDGTCRAFCGNSTEQGTATITPNRATVIADIAAATCRTAFRCCNTTDLTAILRPLRGDETVTDSMLARFRERLPPTDTDFTEEECRAVVADVYQLQPFGPWLRQVDAGRVQFNEAAYAECLSALQTASCGAEAAEVLGDGTCLSFSPPPGGDDQRKIFTRSSTTGAQCQQVLDGFGARFYGTCNPQTSFCCYTRPETGADCRLPSDDPNVFGACREAPGVNEVCSINPNRLLICETGLSCNFNDRCVPDATGTVGQAGDVCFDGGIVADCVEGTVCDIGDTNRCIRQFANGARCSRGIDCVSGICEGI